MLNTLIIDDEPKARRLMCTMIEAHCPELNIKGTAEDVPQAVKLINKFKPDLIFLDIEMPGFSGFELLDFFEEINFQIVFTTAYSEYAIQAFQVSAVDYLMKPIEIQALKGAVQKVIAQQSWLNQKEQLMALKSNLNPASSLKKIAIPNTNGLLFVESDEIIYLKADGSYTQVFLKNGKSHLVSRKISTFENILSHPSFFKVHRSYLINLNHIQEYVRNDGGYIVMHNGDKVSLARDRRDEFMSRISS